MSPYFQCNQSVDRLCVQFFRNKSCIELSKALLGQILCRRLSPDGPILKGRIVETEAYLGVEDKSCHSYGGRRTKRNEPMFMSSGTTYVYFTYGMYYCFNLSAEDEGSVVLLRAVQPLQAIDFMNEFRTNFMKRRHESSGHTCHETKKCDPKPYKLKALANGPSKLCICFHINKDNMNKVDITDSPFIWIERADCVSPQDIVCDKRIGLSGDHEWVDKELRLRAIDCIPCTSLGSRVV
ncbi:unnamed protein product [Oppiella nova]|uniref:DNA-3-methyladenine glycosylase n=1 Tax=Oppiella nova TaxID=334625 RepID=A0A7R9QEA3_9ACAR|nr:unnamed protein product [Oppiella nova]CAG2164075.1 unnamed protein product [Oppiella nova]